MKKSTCVAAAAFLTLSAAGLTTSAMAGGGGSNDAGGADKVSARAVGGAEAPNSRIAAFVSQGGSVVRSKGINGVSHPSTGLYCIDPKSATFNVNKAVPVLSIDWSSSLGDALMAQWRSTGIGCPAGQFAVLTFDGEDGTFDLSDSVSFTFVVS